MHELLLNEFNFKIDEIIKFLKNNKGHEYKVYNYDHEATEPDSDIVEYAENVKDIINIHLKSTQTTELSF